MNALVGKMMDAEFADWETDNQRLREVMQKIVLAGLYRGNFFSEAAFYGGTCLRIFHGLPRCSEDMDFSLLESTLEFDIEVFFPFIVEEFKSLGIEISLEKKDKKTYTAIQSAFLKSNTIAFDLGITSNKNVKIKIEVDTNPPQGFLTESKISLLPFSFMTRCYELPYLYAGKMHALIFRGWQTRVKGRDWFDFEWYVRNGVGLDFDHFRERVHQLNPEVRLNTVEDFQEILSKKIDTVDYAKAREDVAPFIADVTSLDLWSAEYFHEVARLIRFND